MIEKGYGFDVVSNIPSGSVSCPNVVQFLGADSSSIFKERHPNFVSLLQEYHDLEEIL